MKSSIKKKLKHDLRGRVLFGEPLKRHTTFKIGGPAEIWIEPRDLTDLERALELCRRHKIKVCFLGNGSNILASDEGTRGAVIKLSAPFFKRIEFCRNRATAASGAPLSKLIKECTNKKLGGMEFLAGIPGTVGGATAMNAGIKKKSISDVLDTVKVIDQSGRLKEFTRDEIDFGYRGSSLLKMCVVAVTFNLKRAESQALKKRYKKYLNKKKLIQEYTFPNAGCIFKNPEGSGKSAGQLLDAAGLKGQGIGGARFSDIHANFIINTGRACAADVTGLMKIAKAKVKKRFNVCLEPEVKIIS